MSNTKARRRVMASSALMGSLFYAILASSAQAQEQPYTIDIPAESLSSALRDFAKASGQQIIFTEPMVAGRSVGPIQGSYSADAALTKILSGSGLSYSRASNGGIVVQIKNVQATSNEALPPAKSVEVETVVVTGTNIRGIQNDTIPLDVIDRAQIERSGYSTTEDLVRNIPQNFAGGALGVTEDGPLGPGFYATTNISYASGLNLRGLGAASTLVLVNGHRIAPASFGISADISTIPLEAVDRVEIVPDGASAIYGADAVAGVVNFVLRKSYDGQQTWASFGGTADGGRDQTVIGQSIGRSWSGGSGIATFQYENQAGLVASERSFTSTVLKPTNLYPSAQQYTGLFSVEQDVFAGLTISSDGIFSHADKLTQAATTRYVQTNTVSSDQGVLDVNLDYLLAGDWHLDGSGTVSWQDAGVIEHFTAVSCPSSCPITTNFQEWAGDIKADGTIVELPAGALKAAIGGSYRTESFLYRSPVFSIYRPFSRNVSAEYVELEVPVVGTSNAIPFVSKLSLSLALRHDAYSDFGSTTNPRYGVAWSPVDWLQLRSDYNTAFRAPDADEEIGKLAAPQMIDELVAAPTGGKVPVFLLAGTNPNLGPEKARTISAGFDITPEIILGLKVSFNYYDIKYSNRIATTTIPTTALLNQNVFGALITPFASNVAASSFLSAFTAAGGQFFDLLGTGSTGVQYLFNGQTQNVALVRQKGADLHVSQKVEIDENYITGDLDVAYIGELLNAFTPTSPPANLVNTYENPPMWKMRGQIGWSNGPFDAAVSLNYTGAYIDTSAFTPVAAPSWTTVDIHTGFRPPFMDGVVFGFNVINLFDVNPPYVIGQRTTGLHYDIGNANPLGRIVSLNAKVSW